MAKKKSTEEVIETPVVELAGEPLTHKRDFVMLIEVNGANPNGDPLSENMPRTDAEGYGFITDVCLKRKIRNRMQDLGHKIFIQSADRCDDGCDSLQTRAKAILSKYAGVKGSTDVLNQNVANDFCNTYLDARCFGQLLAFSEGNDKKKGVSVGIRGPVSIQMAHSVAPLEIESMQITKSVNGSKAAESGGRSSDTMGTKHFVPHALYVVNGAINCQLAEKTGMSEEDAEVIKECLTTLFENDASAARPEGTMRVARLFWFTHNNKAGQYASATVHNCIKAAVKDGVDTPRSMDDYDISVSKLPDLEMEDVDCR